MSVCAVGGGRIASGSYDKTVRVWDAGTGKGLLTINGHGDAVRSVCAMGEDRIVSASTEILRRPLIQTGGNTTALKNPGRRSDRPG